MKPYFQKLSKHFYNGDSPASSVKYVDRLQLQRVEYVSGSYMFEKLLLKLW